jgi:serine/threonine-protein kinase HipA
MASALWGKVKYKDRFAGELRQEPGGRYVFTYDFDYLAADHPAIAYTLPKSSQPLISEQGLHPFFENLVAEGWLKNAQARALKTDPDNRFALLLAFGWDCPGAVSVIDPAPLNEPAVDFGDPEQVLALKSRASLSGVQAKLLAVGYGKGVRPARRDETSMYIAKLPSGSLGDIVENEFLATTACRALLPDDAIVDVRVGKVEGIGKRALIVPRFDRLRSGTKIHFEEFNQLLGRYSGDDKYEAAYEDMAAFIRDPATNCASADAWRLFRRILACFLIGNTDAHLKNFAMFHTRDGLRLAPAYDLVAAALYPEYRMIALSVGGATNLSIGDLKPKHIVALGEACGLNTAAITQTIADLDCRRAAAAKAVTEAAARIGEAALGEKLNAFMESRWNGSFSLIGRYLSKK